MGTKTASKKRASKKKRAGTKRRSSIAGHGGVGKFPRHSVEKALRIPRAVLDQNAGKACTPKEAAEFLGVKVAGPFHVEIGSAIKYGFLSRPEPGKIEPTDLAKRILRPQNDNDEIEGYREAILQAPDISDVYKHYRGENLPDEKFFTNTVVETYKVPPEKAAEFRDIFIESLDSAGLLSKHAGKARVIDVSEEDMPKEGKTERIRRLGKAVKIEAGETCFVMQPFAPPLGEYYEKIYRPAIEKAGFTAVRADAEIFATGKIIDQVWRGINNAKVLVAELTSRNPNVFYELGLAHALRKPVVLVSSNEDDVPFDLQHIRVIYYDVHDPFWGTKLVDKIAENILSAIQNPEEAIFRGSEEAG